MLKSAVNKLRAALKSKLSARKARSLKATHRRENSLKNMKHRRSRPSARNPRHMIHKNQRTGPCIVSRASHDK